MILKNYKNRFLFSIWISIVPLLSTCGGPLIPKPLEKMPQFENSSYFELPYRVENRVFYPLKAVGHFTQEGIASWYGQKFHGKMTSNKEIYDMYSFTAAHKTLPFGTLVQVINLDNGKKVKVRINDRGPFVNDRIIDLSYNAARSLAMASAGTVPVRLTVLNPNLIGTSNLIRSSKYSIQMGIFKDISNAKVLQKSILEGWIDTVLKGGTKYYRVLVGSFDQYEKALKKMDKLHFDGYSNAFIISP